MSGRLKTHIHVFITKKFEFRADITKINTSGVQHKFSVTVGSNKWKDDESVEPYKERIIKKCEFLVSHLDNKLQNLRYGKH